MKKKLIRKIFSIFVSLQTLSAQVFFPVFVSLPDPAFAKPPATATIDFKKKTNTFEIKLKASGESSYILAYRTSEDKTEVVTGIGEDSYEKDIYAGTCSLSVCTPHVVIRGILKVEVINEAWINSQGFEIDKGKLKIIYEKSASGLELTKEENYWLENGEDEAEPTPSPSLSPSAAPAPMVLMGAMGGPSALSTSIQNGCMEDVYGGDLNCTANDVGIAEVTNVIILDDGCMYPGDQVEFQATYTIVSTASERHDVGVYFATDGDPNSDGALSGSCDIGIMPYDPSPPWLDLDGTGDGVQDVCGDINTDPAFVPFQPVYTFTTECIDTDGDNLLDVPYCTSWRQPGHNELCEGPLDAYPGAPSKCKCDEGFEVPIIVPFSAEIEVIKDLEPDNDLGTFNLRVNLNDEATCVGDGGSTGKVIVSAGTNQDPGDNHTVSEAACIGTDLLDYNIQITCVDRGLDTFNGGSPLTLSGPGPLIVPVDKDDDIVCTVLNSVKSSSLTVIKHVINDNGGILEADDFTINVTGNNPDPSSFPGDEFGTQVTLEPGVYSVDEDFVAGYTKTLSPDCTGTLLPGESKTCTITNNDIPATLIVEKVVFNDNGGTLTYPDFSFSVNGGPAESFEADGVNEKTVSAGTYTVIEPSVFGYATTYTNCTNVVIPIGGTETCIITNNDIAPTLTLVKTVINDNGGIALFSNFQAYIGINPVPWNQAQTLPSGDYTASEDTVSGYDPSIWTGDCETDGDVSLAVGENKTCYITNDDQPATLIVKKIVINDDGGTLTYPDFSFSVNGAGAVSFEADGQNDLTVNAGTYTVTEPPVSGYTTTYSNCTDVVIPNGGTETCTITNNDKPGMLTVIKHVINDDGGTLLADDFSINVAGTNPNPSSFPGDETGTQVTLDAGTYSVDEDFVFGYEKTLGANCSGTIANGESKTCTITNDDIAPTLTLVKTVENNYGGTAVISDFQAYIDSSTAPWNLAQTLLAGSYTASEDPVSGYSPSAWTGNCEVNGDVYLSVGDNKTCYITNSDQPGSVSGKKFDDLNGDASKDVGEPGLSGWTIELKTLAGALLDSKITDASGNYQFNDVSVGDYLVCEVEQTGYTRTYPETSNCHQVSVALNEDVVNIDFGNFENISVTVCKVEDLNGDGNILFDPFYTQGWEVALEGDIELTDSQGCYQYTDIGPGNYDVTEEVMAGWVQTYPTQGSFNFDAVSGQNEIFNFGNFKPGKVFGYKYHDLNQNGKKDDGEPYLNDWEICLLKGLSDRGDLVTALTTQIQIPVCVLTGSGVWGDGYFEFTGLLAGQYNLYEILKSGWQQSEPVGNSYPVLIQSGTGWGVEEQTYYFGNYALNPELVLEKSNNRESDSLSKDDVVTFTIKVVNNGPGKAYDVVVADTMPVVEYFDYLENTGHLTCTDGTDTDLTATGTNPYYWNFGDMDVEEECTLTYDMKILNDEIKGTHKNIAGASAMGGDEETHYSNTDVSPFSIGIKHKPGGEYKGEEIVKEGEVLGAATGSSTLWLILSLILMSLGGILKLMNKKKLAKLLKSILPVLVLTASFMVSTVQVLAADTTLPVVAIVKLPNYLNKRSFEISYTALDAGGSGLKSVHLEYKKEGDSWKSLGTFSDAAKKVQLTTSHINDDAKYYFKATACDNDSNCSVDETSTTIDTHAPPKPESYSKQKIGVQSYKIKWHNPNSDDLDKVYIYRDDNKDWKANDSTKVGEVSVTKNTDSDWTDAVVPDSTKDYYYAIRNVDKAGNASDLVGDTYSTTTTTEGTPQGQQVTGQEAVPGQTLQTLPTQPQGQILGEKTEEEMEAEEATKDAELKELEKLLVEEEATQEAEGKRNNLLTIGVVGVLVLAGLGYFLKDRKK
ncbi:SdrD B-like domain-containing protein [Patescibacteria group bacterium]